MPDCTTRQNASRSPGTSEAASSISARTGVMPRVPMMSALVISAPEPVGDVDQLLAGDAREQVLVAAGEPDDLVREHRADDQRDVVLDDRAVDPDLDAVSSMPPDSSAIRSAPMPHLSERVRVPPLVIPHGDARVVRGERPG